MLRDFNGPDLNPPANTPTQLERCLVINDERSFVPTEEIIDEARNGRMFILVDDEADDKGNLVIPGQMATPNAIKFMGTFGGGPICLALTASRLKELGLEQTSRERDTGPEAALATSIDAREGVTKGISATDQARTISVAIDSARGADDIVAPGHVFPFVAKRGGVLVKAGQKEAAVDIARLAGLNPSAVFCELVGRPANLVAFAQLHGLKIGTIRDLIAYRRKHDHLEYRVVEAPFQSRWGGKWTAICFHNKVTRGETMVLVKGRVDPSRPTLVRMHTMSAFPDVFGETGDRQGLLEGAMRTIGNIGAGVVVLINSAAQDFATRALRLSQAAQGPQGAGMAQEERDLSLGAQILVQLGIQNVILLSDTEHSLSGLQGHGLSIVGIQPITGLAASR
jgi:3,4-dihydroxy 2-butanone 4-phosphate synthase/GTP cyclohydrolase II